MQSPSSRSHGGDFREDLAKIVYGATGDKTIADSFLDRLNVLANDYATGIALSAFEVASAAGANDITVDAVLYALRKDANVRDRVVELLEAYDRIVPHTHVNLDAYVALAEKRVQFHTPQQQSIASSSTSSGSISTSGAAAGSRGEGGGKSAAGPKRLKKTTGGGEAGANFGDGATKQQPKPRKPRKTPTPGEGGDLGEAGDATATTKRKSNTEEDGGAKRPKTVSASNDGGDASDGAFFSSQSTVSLGSASSPPSTQSSQP